MACGLGLVDRQPAGQLRTPSGTAGPALRLLRLFGKGPSGSLAFGIALAVVLSRRCGLGIGSLGSRLSGLLFCGTGLLLAAAGMVSSSLRFQRCLGPAQGIQPVLAALQFLGSSSPRLPLP